MVGKVSLDVSAADTLYNTHASEWPSHHSFKPDHLVTVKSSKPAVFIGCNGLVFKTMSGGQKIPGPVTQDARCTSRNEGCVAGFDRPRIDPDIYVESRRPKCREGCSRLNLRANRGSHMGSKRMSATMAAVFGYVTRHIRTDLQKISNPAVWSHRHDLPPLSVQLSPTHRS